jgi:hypothetical protein
MKNGQMVREWANGMREKIPVRSATLEQPIYRGDEVCCGVERFYKVSWRIIGSSVNCPRSNDLYFFQKQKIEYERRKRKRTRK